MKNFIKWLMVAVLLLYMVAWFLTKKDLYLIQTSIWNVGALLSILITKKED